MRSGAFFAILLFSVLSPATRAEEILAVLGRMEENQVGALARIDPETAEATVLGFPLPGEWLAGLAVLPDGRTFGISTDDQLGVHLVQIDPTNGSVIRDVGIVSGLPSYNPGHLEDLAAHPITGELLGVTGQCIIPNSLCSTFIYQIDPETAAATRIYWGEAPIPDAIAFSDDGRLWGVTQDIPSLFEIDLEGGGMTAISLNPPIGGFALGNGGDGTLLMVECCDSSTGSFANQVYRVDPDTGTATLIGDVGPIRSINDIDLGPPPITVDVPTLDWPAASVLALALASVGLIFLARR